MKGTRCYSLLLLFLPFVVVADTTTIRSRKRGTLSLAAAAATTSLSPTEEVTIHSDPAVAFLLKLLRGGGGSNDYSLLRHFWKIGTKPWKFAVEKVTPKTRNRHFGHETSSDDHLVVEQGDDQPPESFSTVSKPSYYSPLQMYASCMGIVTLWILTGTLFYSHVNEWPIPQSFFYAVDAGMSIGFCTDVAETKLVSKAFTVIYIVLGASVVGGALALFIQDIVEGVVDRGRKNNSSILTRGYELMLEKGTFEKFEIDHGGTLSRDQFAKLLRATAATSKVSEDDIDVLWKKFDSIKDGVIHFEEFVGTSRGIKELIDSFHDKTVALKKVDLDDDKQSTATKAKEAIVSLTRSVCSPLKSMWNNENRIYGVFVAWVLLGITWGMADQSWDIITSTHFAISALATGGLTGPAVNSDGILPTRPSIFCGCYCLFGIPLMAITFGHFAQRLVSDHVAAMEEWALTQPMTATDYKIAKQYLTGEAVKSSHLKSKQSRGRQQQMFSSSSVASRGLCLSDFVVLQLLRQGKLSVQTLDILRKEFDFLDMDRTGLLTLQEATNWSTNAREEVIVPPLIR
mmetsp:Transcript_25824/g.56629  ORF Transcript_25824/g.56629 Transcript_25824/m.56629 type:complete len:571 (-) Transcript_25824:400-2112(-)